MKFPRNAKLFRGQLDAAPLVGVLFLLMIFLLLNSTLVFTPGIQIALPEVAGADLPGPDQPTLVVAIDRRGQYYFDHQIISAADLGRQLNQAVRKMPNLSLIVEADRSGQVDPAIQLCQLARNCGIRKVLWATRPALFSGEVSARQTP
jgi:biopolymer transport protein ExbD